MLRNRASGPEIGPDSGRTATGKAPRSALRPAFGGPEGRFQCFPDSSPAKIRPGSLISGPEALLCNIEYAFECLILGPRGTALKKNSLPAGTPTKWTLGKDVPCRFVSVHVGLYGLILLSVSVRVGFSVASCGSRVMCVGLCRRRRSWGWGHSTVGVESPES
jgi:hypothetical protein